MKNYFEYKGRKYYKGTIVQIYEKDRINFGFYNMLRFTGCDNDNSICYFSSLYDLWHQYSIPDNQLETCIEIIAVPCGLEIQENQDIKVDPKYIDGIVSAWIWYILAMIFGLFLKGPINTIGTWVLASIVFFGWRRKKMKGE